jgi:hypothetical protein
MSLRQRIIRVHLKPWHGCAYRSGAAVVDYSTSSPAILK